MTENPFVNLRNDISGVVETYSQKDADQWLNHPVFGKHLSVVRTDKPEVLKNRDAEESDDKKKDEK